MPSGRDQRAKQTRPFRRAWLTGEDRHADDRGGLPRKHSRRSPRLCRRRTGRGRDHPPGIPQRGAIVRDDLRPQARAREPRRDDLRGGWRHFLDLFPAAAHARGPCPPVRDPSAHRLMDARLDRPLPRQLPELRERTGDGPGDVRPHPAGFWRQHPQLLSPYAQERHLRVPHRHQSAGLACCEPGRRAELALPPLCA